MGRVVAYNDSNYNYVIGITMPFCVSDGIFRTYYSVLYMSDTRYIYITLIIPLGGIGDEQI